MKIALIGATGFVGSAVLYELLQRSHEVTAIVRKAGKLHSGANLRVVLADIMNEEALINALAGNEAVISAFNPGWNNPNLYQDFLPGAKSIQAAVKKVSISRYIFVGGAGSLFISPKQQIVDTPGFPAEWKPGALAARDYLNTIRKEVELEWTFLSPAVEMHAGTSGIRKGTYRTGLDEPVFDAEQRSVISVEDTAVAIADELEKPRNIRKRFTIAY